MINLLQDENVKGIISNFHNITGRVTAEEQRKNLEQKFIKEKNGAPKGFNAGNYRWAGKRKKTNWYGAT